MGYWLDEVLDYVPSNVKRFRLLMMADMSGLELRGFVAHELF